MKLLYATQNAAKVINMRRRLAGTCVEILTPADLNLNIDVVEDGKTPAENAMKKALAYHAASAMPTLAADSGLYIDGLSEDQQPGLFVRRVGGVLLTDDEMIDHYAALAASLGGSRRAHYRTGLALIADGQSFCTELSETEFILTSHPNPRRAHTGNPLDVVALDPRTNRYHNDLTDEDFKDSVWHFERGCREFVLGSLRKAFGLHALADELCSHLKTLPEVKSSALYGSLTTDHWDCYSDIDVEIDASGADNGALLLRLPELLSHRFPVVFFDYAPSLAPEKYVVTLAIDASNPFRMADITCAAIPHHPSVSAQMLRERNDPLNHMLKLFSANVKHYLRGADCRGDIERMYRRVFSDPAPDAPAMLRAVYNWLEQNVSGARLAWLHSFEKHIQK